MIDLKKLKDLVKLMVSNDLTELDLLAEGQRVTLKRGAALPVMPVATPGVPPGPSAAVEPVAVEHEDEQGVPILSPMVGTFYPAPSPDAKPFVTVGDPVEPDTVVCIIEAMKVFNEIKAETTGTIAKILVDNGQAVQFDQPLFMIKGS